MGCVKTMDKTFRAIVFSDLHLKNYTRFAEWNEEGLTTRADDCLSVVDLVFDEAQKRRIKNIFFGGDLFHDRSKIDVSLFNATYEKFNSYRESGISVFFVAGNHDQVSKNEVTNSIQLFDNIENVFVLNGEIIECDGFDIVGIQATENKDILHSIAVGLEVDNPAILLTHSQITNSVTTSGARMFNGLPVNELSKKYVGVVCGDIHQYQVFSNNIIVPGCPLQHNFSDKDSEKYILDVEFCVDKPVKIKKIKTNKPKFFTINSDDALSVEDDFNFYVISCNKVLGIDVVDKIKNNIKNVEFVFDIKTGEFNGEQGIKGMYDKEKVLSEYIDGLSIDFDKKEILELSKSFL